MVNGGALTGPMYEPPLLSLVLMKAALFAAQDSVVERKQNPAGRGPHGKLGCALAYLWGASNCSTRNLHRH